MPRKYRVAAPWGNHGEGDEILATDYPGINFPALVQGAILEPVSPRVTCPACQDAKVKRPPAFEKQDTLGEHYRLEHPALATPDIDEVLDGNQKRIS